MRKSIAVLLIVAAFAALTDDAQATFILNFDEQGNGLISQNGGPFVPDPGQLFPDPSQPGSPPALTFFLPEFVPTGNVFIFEPPGFTFPPSDVLRFTDANGRLDNSPFADRMIFYSDKLDGNDALADSSGLPSNIGAGFFLAGINETGSEGGYQDFQWVPGGGNVFNGISDVPEPSTMTLLGLGIVGLLSYAWRARKRRP